MEKNSTKPDVIDSFLNDKIFLNGIEYKRGDFEKISTESNCSVKPHPFNSQIRTVNIEKEINVNGIDCKALYIEVISDVIVSMILYPHFILPLIAACSVEGKLDIYETPMGTLSDYVYDESHKISIGPDGCMVYIWYDKN